MANATKIEWADVTVNPIVGCTHCSPGCDNCYAERFADRLAKNPATADKYRGVVRDGRWTGKMRLNPLVELHSIPGKGKRVFVGSMCDLFHPSVPDEWRDRVFADILADHIMQKGHEHTFMCLTKRAEGMQHYFQAGKEVLLRRWWQAGDGRIDCLFASAVEGLKNNLWPLPNVWLGVTVCNQEEAEAKIPLLLQVPASRRFVSVEPMLGPVDIGRWLPGCDCDPCMCGTGHSNWLDWVICGGETGRRARPLHPDWVRSLRDQCKATIGGAAFFFKSWGEWSQEMNRYALYPDRFKHVWQGKNGATTVYWVGKRMAGRLLDGLEWSEIPSRKG